MNKLLFVTHFGHNILYSKKFIEGSGNYSFYKNFKRLNMDVKVFSLDEKGLKYLYNTLPAFWEVLYFHGFKKIDNALFQNRLIKIAKNFKPHITFIMVGNNILPQTLKKLKKYTKYLVLWCGLDPEKAHWDNVVQSVPYYTEIFIVDPYWREKFIKWGGKKIFQQDLGVDEEVFKPIKLKKEEIKKYGNDLTFVGQWNKERENFFLNLSDYDLGIWGKGWAENVKKDSPLYEHIRGFAFGKDIAKIYNASKIVINIHTPFTKYGINMRTFEAAGCGTFQLVDEKDGIFKLFDVGREIITYKNINDLRNKIEYYLINEEERMKIAIATYNRVMRDHKYSDIVKNILNKLEI